MIKLENQKRISNLLEKSIYHLLQIYRFNCKINHSKGIDIITDNQIKIEIKSSYRYSVYRCKKRNQNVRFSHYSFKPNELLSKIDYYIFIEKVNKINDFNYIKFLKIKVIHKFDLEWYLEKNNFDLTKRIQLSVNTIRKIKNFELFELFNLLNKG